MEGIFSSLTTAEPGGTQEIMQPKVFRILISGSFMMPSFKVHRGLRPLDSTGGLKVPPGPSSKTLGYRAQLLPWPMNRVVVSQDFQSNL